VSSSGVLAIMDISLRILQPSMGVYSGSPAITPRPDGGDPGMIMNSEPW
jgi:hypothetical protein